MCSQAACYLSPALTMSHFLDSSSGNVPNEQQKQLITDGMVNYKACTAATRPFATQRNATQFNSTFSNTQIAQCSSSTQASPKLSRMVRDNGRAHNSGPAPYLRPVRCIKMASWAMLCLCYT
uniref:Uncharacterized protein n=1 Tax=Setaria digitata TaxID=48799 RepID=A0A915PDU0_9BILA